MYGVELVENKSTQTPLDIPTVELIIRRCKENGLMIRNLENVITFVPILSMSNKLKKWLKFSTKPYIKHWVRSKRDLWTLKHS